MINSYDLNLRLIELIKKQIFMWLQLYVTVKNIDMISEYMIILLDLLHIDKDEE